MIWTRQGGTKKISRRRQNVWTYGFVTSFQNPTGDSCPPCFKLDPPLLKLIEELIIRLLIEVLQPEWMICRGGSNVFHKRTVILFWILKTSFDSVGSNNLSSLSGPDYLRQRFIQNLDKNYWFYHVELLIYAKFR